MKKYLKFFLAALTCAALTFAFSGCGEEKDNNISGDNDTRQESTPGNNSENTPGNDSEDTSGNDSEGTPGNDSESTPGNDSESTPEDSDTSVTFEISEILGTLPTVSVNSIEITVWQLVGGMVNNSELTDEQFRQVLANFGGFYNIIFNQGGRAIVAAGENQISAEYELTNENTGITIQNENAYMAGVFTMTDGVVTMIIVNQNDPETVLYFRQLDEK